MTGALQVTLQIFPTLTAIGYQFSIPEDLRPIFLPGLTLSACIVTFLLIYRILSPKKQGSPCSKRRANLSNTVGAHVFFFFFDTTRVWRSEIHGRAIAEHFEP